MFVLAALTVFVALPVSAEMTSGYPYEMMRSVESSVVGEEVHEEMEGLMIKMMSGEMTEAEVDRMVELMEEYPGPQGMMMNRMMGGYGMGYGAGYGMMGRHSWGGWGAGFWFFVIAVASVAWTLVGIFAAVWLWKQIVKKQ